MTYSIISCLALVLNLIINRDAFKNFKLWFKERKDEERVSRRYSLFLMVANCYFIFDIGWGFFYEHRESNIVFPLLYITTVFYFIFMFLTALTWMRYIVAFLDKKGRRTTILLYSVWTLFTIAVVGLIINRFYPFIFTFDGNHDYITQPGRHAIFILQIVLYMATTTYILYLSHKSLGEEKVRHIAVALTCFVMELFLLFQILEPNHPFYAIGLIIGIGVIHSFVESGEKKEKEVYDSLARGLAEDYAAMYYIEIETGEYREFAISDEYKFMNVPVSGHNFYAETQENISSYVYHEDRETAQSIYHKDTMIKLLEGRTTYSFKYRLMVERESRFFLFTLKYSKDGKHFILYVKDIEDDIKAEAARQETQKKNATFTQIAESLAVNYDVIYYVNAEDSSYVSYECRNIYGQLDIQKNGEDYFAESIEDVSRIVHKGDRDIVLKFLDKDNMINALEDYRSRSIQYRISVGKKTHYVRMTARKASDGIHYIIGIENIDDEIRKEKQHLRALKTEKELARRDELTGVKNKTAYHELEESVQESIDSGIDYLSFAFVVCDANDLKRINDTEGHVAGDEYIKQSAMILCNIFAHSPVFRVGGDEFVVFLNGNDYTNREELMNKLHHQVDENVRSGSGPILASGMSEFDFDADSLVSDVFDRADREMYENKQKLKERN